MMRIRGTVFEHLKAASDEEAGIDQDALKGLFSQDKNPPPKAGGGGGGGPGGGGGGGPGGAGGASASPAGGGKQKQVITMLDLKRGSNIEIMLSQMKATLDDIAAAVQTMVGAVKVLKELV